MRVTVYWQNSSLIIWKLLFTTAHPSAGHFTDLCNSFSDTGTVVKQADVILLGFPLMVNMSQRVRQNDLLYYESYKGRDVTDPNGPAMTWGMFAVGWIELGNMTKANQLFQKSFANIQQPFKVGFHGLMLRC